MRAVMSRKIEFDFVCQAQSMDQEVTPAFRKPSQSNDRSRSLSL